jgi:hypothetical protein
MHRQLIAARTALLRNRAARNRHQAARARHDMRTWQVERRKRTRHLIELGGLIVKAGLVNLTGDDRAVILGALLWMADKLQSNQGEQARALWAAKGKQAFEADAATHKKTDRTVPAVRCQCRRPNRVSAELLRSGNVSGGPTPIHDSSISPREWQGQDRCTLLEPLRAKAAERAR